MKSHPIIFDGVSVRAILAGHKTQTRRVLSSLQGFGRVTEFGASDTRGYDFHFRNKRMLWNDVRTDRVLTSCPYGAPGDELWVRETHLLVGGNDQERARVVYRATNDGPDAWLSPVWRPSIYMPRWASRITLRVTDVRVQRVHEISELDCEAELGVAPYALGDSAYSRFSQRWSSLNSERGFGWAANPWVWVVSFERVATQSEAA